MFEYCCTRPHDMIFYMPTETTRSPAWARSLPPWSTTRLASPSCRWCKRRPWYLQPLVSPERIPMDIPEWMAVECGTMMINILGYFGIFWGYQILQACMDHSWSFRSSSWQVNNFTLETNNNVTALQQTVDRTDGGWWWFTYCHIFLHPRKVEPSGRSINIRRLARSKTWL